MAISLVPHRPTHWPAQHMWTGCTVVLAHATILWGLQTSGPARPPATPPEPAIVIAATLIQAASAAPVTSTTTQATPKPATTPAPETSRQTKRPPHTKLAPQPKPPAATRPATSTTAAATPPTTPTTPPPSTHNIQTDDAIGHADNNTATAATNPATTGLNTVTSGNNSAPNSVTTKVELPNASASYLNNPKPPYPALSKRLGEEGKVVLRVWIDTNGTATRAEIQTSSGYERLDQTALQTVLNWRYIPGKRAGVPAAMWFHIPLNFVLE